MEIRKATLQDYSTISHMVAPHKLPYLRAAHIHADIEANHELVAIEDGHIVGIAAIVWDSQYSYWAIKRLLIPNKKNRGKGIARTLILAAITGKKEKIGCTPWKDNIPMIKLLESLDFQLEYIFDDKWCFYSKKGE